MDRNAQEDVKIVVIFFSFVLIFKDIKMNTMTADNTSASKMIVEVIIYCVEKLILF